MFVRFPVMAVLSFAIAVAVLGTDRLGRPLTLEEKRTLAAELRAHDYEKARLVALRFAFKLARNRDEACDLLDRVDSRLVRQGWDSEKVELVHYLCRLTWSEWTHSLEEQDASRRNEDAYASHRAVVDGTAAPSDEERATHAEARSGAEAEGRAALAKLRARFEAEGDEVNLLWLDAALEQDGGLPDPRALAARTGRDVRDFYAAAKRRKRAVARILGETSPTRE